MHALPPLLYLLICFFQVEDDPVIQFVLGSDREIHDACGLPGSKVPPGILLSRDACSLQLDELSISTSLSYIHFNM